MDYPELTAFFAAHRVADIQNVPEYAAYCARNLDALGFRDARDKTEVAKKAIEDRLDGQPNAAGQLRQALKLLVAQRSLDFDRYRELISVGYKPAWSREQQVYFEHAVRIIRSGYYFFLSFTKRGPEDLGKMRVNRQYWELIKRKIEPPSKGDLKERNLLAHAIYVMLRSELLEGFYYPRHDNDNSLVERKLREACESCLVFVQLVDNAMFSPPKDPNFCEFEYRHALDFIRQAGGPAEDRVLFVVTERDKDDLPDPLTVGTYGDWVRHIQSKAAVYLPPVADYDKRRIDEIKEKLAAVVSQVKAAKKNMLERVPD